MAAVELQRVNLEEGSGRPVRHRMNVRLTKDGLPSIEYTVDGQDSGWSAQQVLDALRQGTAALVKTFPPGVALEPGTTIPIMEVLSLGDRIESLLSEGPAFVPEHTSTAHPRSLCLCGPIGGEPPVCEECGRCQCDEGYCGKGTGHARGCSKYPRDDEGGND